MQRAVLLLLFACLTLSAVAALPPEARLPVIDGEWWQVAGVPDLGDLNGEGQQPVDFAIWQAADGTWQIWSCVRGTNCGGNSRLLFGWEGKNLTDTDWTPVGVRMTARPEYGETPGGLQAPHVVKVDGKFIMLYGDWLNICMAESTDGKNFTRVVQENGRTRLFTEGPGCNTRDVMSLYTRGLWHSYYTAYPYETGMIWMRTTRDFKTWSDSTPVAFGGEAGKNPWSAECPFVLEHAPGQYYLFRTQSYGRTPKTRVYYSTDPTRFGLNQDDQYLAGMIPVAAPEFFEYQGQWYVAALNLELDGIRIARIKWVAARPPMTPKIDGNGVFNFFRSYGRKGWKVVEGDITEMWSSSRLRPYNPYYHQFISTAEDGERSNYDLMGVIESPAFTLERDRYAILVGGGEDRERLYVALVDEADNEIVRLTGENDYPMRYHVVDTSKYTGRRAKIRVVDSKKGGWGVIRFGGIFELRED